MTRSGKITTHLRLIKKKNLIEMEQNPQTSRQKVQEFFPIKSRQQQVDVVFISASEVVFGRVWLLHMFRRL